MQKIVQLLFPFILCVMQFSCNQDRYSELLNLDLSQIDSHSEIAISNVVQDLRYISLATKENCLIANKFKIYVVEDFIITIARNQIFIFDKQSGEFLRSIAGQGEGPNEYLRVSTILPVQEDIHTIFAYSNNGLIGYSYEGENVVNVSRPKDSTCNDMLRISSDLYAGYQFNESTKLLLFNKNGEVLRQFANNKILDGNIFLYPNSMFYTYGHKTNFYESVNDTIFQLDLVEGCKARYHLDWGSHQIILQEMSNPVISKQFCYPQNIYESDSLLIVQYVYQGKNSLAICDKSNSKVMHCQNGGKLENDIDSFVPVTVASIDEKQFVGYITVEDFFEWKECHSAEWMNNPKLELFQNLNEMDNPIIVIGNYRL